jgi:hypothetical protein
MLKVLFLSALLAPCAAALPGLSGTIRDSTKGPIDGAKVTLWDATTGRGLQNLSSKGLFSLSNVTEGDYLFKVESDGRVLLFLLFNINHIGVFLKTSLIMFLKTTIYGRL